MFEPAVPARARSVLRPSTCVVSAALLLFAVAGPLHAQVVTRVSVDSSGAESNGSSDYAAISADGTTVAFVTAASNLFAGAPTATWQIVVHDRVTGVTECASVSTAGAVANGNSFDPALSSDGKLVAFESLATNLVDGDSNAYFDVFLRDRVHGTTERVNIASSGKPQDGGSYAPALSANGRFVAFVSDASNLVQGDDNGCQDVFVRDRQKRVTERMSVDSAGAQGNARSYETSLSADGNFVAFTSEANNLVANDRNQAGDVFVHDRTTGITERVSVSSSGVQGNGWSLDSAISSNGQVVAFTSFASNLSSGDTNGRGDVFVHDRATGTTERVSLSSSGRELDSDSEFPSISADGAIVAFASWANNVAGADRNGVADVFLRDRNAGTTAIVSCDCAWRAGDGESINHSLSDDGMRVAFSSLATDLVDGDANALVDVFVNDFTAPPVDASWSNYGVGFAGTLGIPTLTASADPAFGTTISIDIGNSYGNWSDGMLLIGLASASIPTSAGGTLLVAPLLQTLVVLRPSGVSLLETIPRDPALCGVVVYLQVLELDPGAAKGISFTPGLQLVVGH
jgi:Tol biopolymer transport system component